MANVGAQNVDIDGVAEAIEHPKRVAPGDTNLARDAEAPCLIGEDIDDPPILLKFIRVELAVAVGAGDAVDAGGMEASNILAEDPFVKPILPNNRGRDRRPNAVQIVTRQPLRHRDRRFRCDPFFSGSPSAMSG